MRVEIFIPTFQSEPTLEKSIRSVLCQRKNPTGSDYELKVIVSDHGSTDGTVALVERLQNEFPELELRKRIRTGRLFDHWNLCISESQAELIGLFHADDLYDPLIVSKQVHFLSIHDEAKAVMTGAWLIDQNDQPLWEVLAPGEILNHSFLDPAKTFSKVMTDGNGFLICPSTLFRRSALVAVGGFPTRFPNSGDLALWWTLLFSGRKIGYISEPLMSYRLSSGQASGSYEYTRTEESDFFRVMNEWLSQANPSQDSVGQWNVLRTNDQFIVALSRVAHGKSESSDREIIRKAALAWPWRGLGGGDRIRRVLVILCYPLLILPGLGALTARWVLKETDLRRNSLARRWLTWVKRLKNGKIQLSELN